MSRNSIKLVVADLDGTLLDPHKALTRRAIQSIDRLRSAGIRFTMVSGRPPFGMRMYTDPLKIRLAIGGFNGAEITTSDFTTIQRRALPAEVSRDVASFFEKNGIHYWIYRGSDWIVTDPDQAHAANEARSVAFSPSVVPSFDGLWEGVTKIVGVSDDHAFLAEREREMKELFRDRANAARSQPYYLDVTNIEATKETFIHYLSETYSIPRSHIAAIGDMPSDLPMFNQCGLSIAMGNALEVVKSSADRVTSSNAEEGFARAMEEFVL